MAVSRGEVWRADLAPTRGTEQSGVRPVLIVQTDRANPHSPHTIVVPFTSRIRQKLLPSHVLVPAGEGGLVYTGGMKRQELEKALRQLGWSFLRHGGRHDVWTDGQRQEAIPRHAEIHDRLARAILRRARGDK